MENKNYYAVIMAGGVGSRFWPVSTQTFPKQFHDMLGAGKSLLQKTYSRLAKFIPQENILILTNEIYKDLIRHQLPDFEVENIVLEPCMRNTAPCILYASLKIQKRNPNALMIVAPSDHWIEQEADFEKDITKCFQLCQSQDILMTLGIKPSFPNTGYGYIQYNNHDERPAKEVIQFTEKPDYKTARKFLKSGNYLWNAGIFVWSVKSILHSFEKHQTSMYNLFSLGYDVYNTPKEAEFIAQNYPKAQNISVDYAIMEPSHNIYVYPANFDWNDLGTWGSLHEKLPKDSEKNAVVNAQVLFKDSGGNMVRTESKKLVIIRGLEDYIVVDNPSTLLIYPKDREQEIKEILAEVKEKFGM